jgi:uncharacterized protein YdhG (YjbR/CyaY superfamily)
MQTMEEGATNEMIKRLEADIRELRADQKEATRELRAEIRETARDLRAEIKGTRGKTLR